MSSPPGNPRQSSKMWVIGTRRMQLRSVGAGLRAKTSLPLPQFEPVMPVRQLSEQMINRIAAGEVVSRPRSRREDVGDWNLPHANETGCS